MTVPKKKSEDAVDRSGYKVIEQGDTVQVIRESDGTGLGAYLPHEADAIIAADR